MAFSQGTQTVEPIPGRRVIVAAGCEAFGFAEGGATLLKIQAKSNTKRSETGVLEAHFATVEEALDWVHKTVHM